MKRKIWISLGVLVILVVIGLGFAGNYFYDVAVAINQKDFIEAADVDGDYDPEDPWLEEKKWYDKIEREEVSIESEDGLKLSGIYIEGDPNSEKVAILAHGYAGNLEQMAPYVKLYHDMGFNVLVPDARGHGTSEGDYIGFGWHERNDYLQWIQLMLDKVGTDAELALFGISMGGATVMNVSGEELPDNVKVIVEDCGYSSLNGELAYQLKDMYDLPEFPLIPVTSLVTKIRSGYWFGEADTVGQIKKIPFLCCLFMVKMTNLYQQKWCMMCMKLIHHLKNYILHRMLIMQNHMNRIKKTIRKSSRFCVGIYFINK